MGKEYEIAKITGICQGCNRQMQPDEDVVAAVFEAEELLERRDYCPDCWNALPSISTAGALGVWRTKVPRPQEKKKLLIDDGLIVNFFERLAGSEEPARINFRFVLALVLMRKKLLVYDGMFNRDGAEIWKMHFKNTPEAHEIVNPKMDEDKIAEVSGQLGQIMECDL
ncbi:MAG: hypothetical protein HZA50_03155 [Planctomycetes bacterium]|nr:hypothetical protein [Planctomycetota bacterium]